MFRGSLPAKIDDRGRLKVPTNYRRFLEETWGLDVFVTSIHGASALLYPLPVWSDLEARLAQMPSTHSVKRRFLERVGYFGQQGSLDAQGRIVVPQLLRESADILGEVLVFGNLDHLEIWNRDAFEKKLSDQPFSEADLEAMSDAGI